MKAQFSIILFLLLLEFSSVNSQVVSFSHKAGFYNSAFQLELSSVTGSVIYYTLDCSTPDIANGSIYQSPLNINTTTIVRAVVVTNSVVSKVVYTQSYLYPESLIRQNNTPSGYPTKWGPYTAISGNAIADYEMDQDLLGSSSFANELKQSFISNPSVSLVTDKDNLFSSKIDSVLGGIYMYTGAPITNFTYDEGRGWERPASVEFFEIDTSFQVNCGIRIQGGHSRRPEKNPKHSFLLEFDSEYGLSKLNYPYFGNKTDSTIENIILKSGFGYTWLHHDNAQRTKASYQEDVWTKDTQRAMGHPSANTRYVHLFLNGMYWGMYMPSERMDKEYGENYFGGDEDDYDVIKDYAEVSDGTIDAWNELISRANAGVQTNEAYLAIQGKKTDGSPDYKNESLVDVVSLADYMLINFYGGNADWDHHNWVAMRNRTNPGKGFKFLSWDAEIIFTSVSTNVLNENNDNCPSRVFQRLFQNEDFKRTFADRVQKHFYNGGVFTPDSAASRWLTRKSDVYKMVIGESARWGDYRRDVHPYQTAGPFDLYIRDNHWMSRQDYVLNNFFVLRYPQFINQLRSAGMFPSFDAPSFKINNTVNYNPYVVNGDVLSFSSSQGTIYYTLNGEDPVDWQDGGILGANAVKYTEPIEVLHSVSIVARVFLNGKWSAALRKTLTIASELENIKLTEIHYKPYVVAGEDASDFEFVELKNTGNSYLDISKMSFVEGVSYSFPSETVFKPNELIVLSSNSNKFLARYGFRPFDEYTGKLNNSGEKLKIVSSTNQLISELTYGTGIDWPQEANGEGYSLVPMNINPSGNQSDAKSWRRSSQIGGSPGEDDSNSITSIDKIVSNKNLENITAYPNPFKDYTFIDLILVEKSEICINIYNLSGQLVKNLYKGNVSPGMHQFVWDGTDSYRNEIAGGLYLYSIEIVDKVKQTQSFGKIIKLD